MNNTTSPRLTFTASDGIYISFQFLIYIFTFFVFILLLLFRKEKELKHRGFLPYFSTIGTVLLSIRFMVSNLSFLKLGNNESLIRKYSQHFLTQNFLVFLVGGLC
jgi:phosphoglycerol transferase MdoB-like AlkP superfamily enzyme